MSEGRKGGSMSPHKLKIIHAAALTAEYVINYYKKIAR